MNRRLSLVLFLILGVALALRWPKLDERPMHNDEAVNAIKFGDLWEHGRYKYDPNEHHGPSLLYATWALGRLTGATGRRPRSGRYRLGGHFHCHFACLCFLQQVFHS